MESKSYVHKYLADAGCGSRRGMIAAMKAGQVKVNGKTIQDPTYTIDPSKDVVSLGKQVVKALPATTYLMLNKPINTVTTNNDPQKRKTVFDLLPEKYAAIRLFAVGRLDQDSQGLLILTNDGELTNKLTHPSYQHEKEYVITTKRSLSDRELRSFARGLPLGDGRTAPAKITFQTDSQIPTYSVIIHEGKKRQIRRMFEHLGYTVITLKRVRIGALWLDKKLKPGQVRPLTLAEVEAMQAKSDARDKR